LSGILFTAEFFSFLSSPIIGAIIHKSTFMKFYGRHRFWLSFGMLPLAITYTVMWTDPGLGKIGSAIYYFLAITLFNLFYSLFLISYEGMIPLLVSGITASKLKKGERNMEMLIVEEVQVQARLNSMRLFTGSCGSILTTILAVIILPRSQGTPLHS
jgi:Na+/melibiose symporter-like transporter